ncbi:hypothetical protein [Pantoea agglomerans]|uniref:hypothetical protein n=1 Tax=Enterobacter agglomerans TaxID=549 RepID=UPI0032092EA9
MMKRLIIAVAALLATSAVSAETAPASTTQTPVFDAQAYATLHNIDARLAELNLKLSAPQVQGCSDGQRVYTEGYRVTIGQGYFRCDVVNERFKWVSINGY